MGVVTSWFQEFFEDKKDMGHFPFHACWLHADADGCFFEVKNVQESNLEDEFGLTF